MSSADQRSAKLKEDNFWHTAFKLSQGVYCRMYPLLPQWLNSCFLRRLICQSTFFPLLH